MSLSMMQDWVTSAFPGGKWKDASKIEWLCAIRDEKTPSCYINIEKRTFCDFGGNSGKLSELCEQQGIPDPYRKEDDFHTRQAVTPPTNVDVDAMRINDRWERATPASSDFPYLKKKQVSSLGLKEDTDPKMGRVLLIPARSPEGVIKGLERITPEGQKMHLGAKSSVYHLIGNLAEGGKVLVSEGLATGLSLHEISGYPVAVSFGSNNLLAVAQLLRDKKNCIPVVCPDADSAGSRATDEALKAGVQVITMPEGSPKGWDWNDLLLKHGLDEARRMFKEQEAKSTEATPPIISKENLLFDSIEAPSPETALIPEKIWHLPRKHLNLLAADSGMGKSILITKIACDLSLGVPVLEGRYEPRRKILYLNGECGKDYFNWRFRASGWSFSADNFKVIHQETLAEKGISLDFDTQQGRKYLELLLSAEKPDLLIIDSCPAFSNSDQNDGQKQNEIAKYLKGLAVQHNMALLLITHLRKRRLQDEEAEPSLSEIQGSNAPSKIANIILVLYEKNVEIDGEYKKIKVCKSVKSWGVPVKPFGYEMPDYGENRLVINPVEIPKKGKTKNSWEALNEALQNTEFTRQDLEPLLGVSAKTAKNTIAEWIQQGKITRKGSGKNTIYMVSKGQTTPPSLLLHRTEESQSYHEKIRGSYFTPNEPPEDENHSGKFDYTESKSVIPIIYKDSGKYIYSGVPNDSVGKSSSFSPRGALTDPNEIIVDVSFKEQEYSEATAQNWLDSEAPEEARELYQEKFDRMHKTMSEEASREKALLRTWEHFHLAE